MKYLISMTWFSLPEYRPKWSKRFFHPKWIKERYDYLLNFLDRNDFKSFVHISGNTELYPPAYNELKIIESLENDIFQWGLPHNNHRHFNSHTGYMLAAQYALCHGLDWVYIEHDCLVYGLDKALEWADGKKIVYGYGDYSYAPGWAEQSFMYVSNEYLPNFLKVINEQRVHTLGKRWPEIVWHQLFKDVAEYWPFGYGRKRPIDFSKDVFYAQQLTDNEIDKFFEKGNQYAEKNM